MAVDEVYNNPTQYHGFPLVLATVFFSFQIYCDFSGYSDIAIGSAKVMGFKLMKNFNQPYFSESIKEFWSRWHISLSTWFRDYLYIALGGNRVGKWRWYYNIFIVFLISGLWHGANWTFIVWGSLHGFYQVFGQLTANTRNRLAYMLQLTRFPRVYKLLQIGTTFTLVSFAWIFFRASSIADAFYISTHLFSGFFETLIAFKNNAIAHTKNLFLGQSMPAITLAFVLLFTLLVIEHFQNKQSLLIRIKQYSFPVRLALYNLLIISILLLGTFAKVKFIYFQF
jgi:D-alanyl-lipoteichoic acid acyltransferase DltB (MBOAT superfamily)